MSKVITFSTTFPKHHYKAGKPTNFGKAIIASLNPLFAPGGQFIPKVDGEYFLPKYHTIRKGHRWKVGDVFSPRAWGDNVNPKSGRSGPYHSMQIVLTEYPLEIKKVWDIEIMSRKIIINGVYYGQYARGFYDDNVCRLANNDGLGLTDFEGWFGDKFFSGQIICWADNIEY